MSDAELVIRRAKERGLLIVLAESCTAGLVSSLLAEVPGASAALWGSLVTYTPEAKSLLLGIDAGLLEKYGVVSRETALAMARGALEKSGAHVALSVTGLAGPDGDGSALPVGTVWIGTASRGGRAAGREYRFTGDRNRIREDAAREALRVLHSVLNRL
ncbi:MAG: CinA family protein [Treponema sp.]|jgi:PncC family amidohydrolase|nr:CinA family protein [Treponema sp.]